MRLYHLEVMKNGFWSKQGQDYESCSKAHSLCRRLQLNGIPARVIMTMQRAVSLKDLGLALKATARRG